MTGLVQLLFLFQVRFEFATDDMSMLMQGEHKTVLLKADGSEFAKTFQWDWSAADVDLGAAAAALQPQTPDDFAAQMGSLSSQQTSGCDGCVGADTRAAAAKQFPHTAIGAPAVNYKASPATQAECHIVCVLRLG